MNDDRQPPASSRNDFASVREKVYTSLDRRSQLSTSQAWGVFLLGAGAILMIGAVLLFPLHILLYAWDVQLGLATLLVFYLVALVPILIWQERRLGRGYFSLTSANVDLTRDPENVSEYLVRRTQMHVAGLVGLLLWGPRAVIAGYRGIRGIRDAGLDRILPEAADTLALMLTVDGGIKISDLVSPGQDPSQLMPVLKWLDLHDYIGISARGDRVWLSSFAKRRLAEDHGPEILPRTKTIAPASNTESASE